ncbi:MAG TPA: iron chelate uptake ABC transporter family permease subunit [Acidimicrobiales bacterium]|nr:iron chelate uptake ABC transporter family permease subunit [Acidimicrobiales bacterium]
MSPPAAAPAVPAPAVCADLDRTGSAARGNRTLAIGLGVAIAVLVVVMFVSLAIGNKHVALDQVWNAVFHFDGSADQDIVRALRVPRTLLGVEAGVALGMAGAVMQGITRNPLADPGILGVNAGAAFAVVLVMHAFGLSTLGAYVWFALLGAAVASVLVYALGALGRDGATPTKLALAGAAVAALLTSLTTAVLLLDVSTLDQFRFWVVGSLAGRDATVVGQVAPFLVVGAAIAMRCGRSLNSLSLGDDVARSLGVRVGLARAAAGVSVVLLCGGATAAAGPILFVGLTVPHVARAICGPDYRWIVPFAGVLAAILLLGSDIVGRVVTHPGEVQVGVVTAMIGAPVFIALVRKRSLAAL